jgi:LmbE family N-acetylglucosaminyl deacetylase
MTCTSVADNKGGQMKLLRGVAALAVVAPLALTGTVANAAAPPQAVVQVVAHEDDDMLFLSPDLITQINNGVDTTTVYITAGENYDAELDNAEAYAAERQKGVRGAYAKMAGITGCDGTSADAGGCWSASTPVFANHRVQLFTLNQRPSVRLIFLNLPENADTRFFGHDGTLTDLWNDRILVSGTVATPGAPAERYDHGDIVDVLSSVMATYSATMVRTQDPAPDLDPALMGDHQDHVVAAEFAGEAVAAYSAGHPRVLLENYRDYNIRDMPRNLMQSLADAKTGIFQGEYAPHDKWVNNDSTTYGAWVTREYSRDPRGTQWAITDGAGLHAFVVEGGSLLEWVEHTNGSWQGPVNHGNPGGPLADGLAVSRNQDGRLEVFGERTDTGDIISLFQTTSGGWSWANLGNPSGSGTDGALRTSTPAVTVNGDGREQVFVRNAGGGISSRWQVAPNGGWDDTWADMGGAHIQGPPSAKTTVDGRIELFAPTTGGILHWYQPAANGTFTVDNNFPQAKPASGLSVAMDQSGRLEVLFRQENTSDVMTIYQSAPGGGFTAAPADLGGQGGVGAPTVVTESGRVVVAEHNGGGGVSFAEQNAPDSTFGGWSDLGGLTVDDAAAVVSQVTGRAELLAVGYDGKLYDQRQQADGSFTGWLLAG